MSDLRYCAVCGSEYNALRGPCPYCADPEHMMLPHEIEGIAELTGDPTYVEIVKSWGGAREGAGRPPLSADEPTERSTITLSKALDDKALRIGDSNRSEGVRRALAAYQE